MEKKTCFDIPYKIETEEDIAAAMEQNFLHLGNDYGCMLALARRARLQKPPALLRAKPSAEKIFYMLREEKIKESRVSFEEIAGIDLIEGFHLIEAALPDMKPVVCHETLFSYLEGVPERVKKHLRRDGRDKVNGFEKISALRQFLRHEILSFARTKRHKNLSLPEVKELMCACALFLPENEDVLYALRHTKQNAAGALYQNNLAELLFCRLPAFFQQIVQVDPKIIRRRLFEKLARLDLSSRQRINLHACFKATTGQEELRPVLDRLDRVAKKTVSPELYKKISSYIMSQKHSIALVPRVCSEWFMSRNLEVMQRMYVPGLKMKRNVTYRDVVLRAWCEVEALRLFPVKDFLDLCKYKISSDCTHQKELGEPQLLCPNFFNIRVFGSAGWIGNIYMLDFADESGVLVVDRIQIPRDIKAEYVDFFTFLREALAELFADADYRDIVLPLRVSNHSSVQKLFNKYRKRLAVKKLNMPSSYSRHFESLRHSWGYYVLCSKAETTQNIKSEGGQ